MFCKHFVLKLRSRLVELSSKKIKSLNKIYQKERQRFFFENYKSCISAMHRNIHRMDDSRVPKKCLLVRQSNGLKQLIGN